MVSGLAGCGDEEPTEPFETKEPTSQSSSSRASGSSSSGSGSSSSGSSSSGGTSSDDLPADLPEEAREETKEGAAAFGEYYQTAFGDAAASGDSAAIKEIEKTTNHDVKAVEYWIKSKFQGQPELEQAGEFVHFACTSEDINNTSHGLMLKAARDEVMLPALDRIIDKLAGMAERLAAFGGELSLSSPEGGPTRVRCTIPLLLERGQTGVSA